MKITWNVPEHIIVNCAYFIYAYKDMEMDGGVYLGCTGVGLDELYDGAEIELTPVKVKDGEEK